MMLTYAEKLVAKRWWRCMWWAARTCHALRFTRLLVSIDVLDMWEGAV